MFKSIHLGDFVAKSIACEIGVEIPKTALSEII